MPSYLYFLGILKGCDFRRNKSETCKGEPEDEVVGFGLGSLLEDVKFDVSGPVWRLDDPSAVSKYSVKLEVGHNQCDVQSL